MVERLTEKHVKKNGGYYMKCSEYCEREETMCIECERSDEIVDRLGAIEDILGNDYDLDRLRELVEADRNGRCVVVTKCFECENHVEFEGKHYCKFWRMDCPNDSEFYCKAGEAALKGDIT